MPTLEHPIETPTPRAPRHAPPRPRRRGRIALVAAGAVGALLVAGQLFLPSFAESRIEDRLAERGTVANVNVSAFPAVKLLAGEADDVQVRMDSFRAPAGAPGGGVGDAFDRIGAAGDLDLSIGKLETGPVTLRDVKITKRGDNVDAKANVPEGDLQGALPPGFDVRPVAGSDGTLRLEGTVRLLGLNAKASARLVAQDGRIVLEPQGGPLAAAATMTVFDDERFQVTRLEARDADNGFTLRAAGRLAG
jgi:hypothetical protein